MKRLKLLLPVVLLGGAGLAQAQELVLPMIHRAPVLRPAPGTSAAAPRFTAPERITPPGGSTPSAGVAAYAPLNLRNGAVWTGLHGFYDYQTNGMAPQYVALDPGEPNNINVVYMLTLDETDVTEGAPTRRVGYAYSSDAGAHWTSTLDIAGYRLGFPSVRTRSDGTAFIAAHGESNGGLRTLLFQQDAPASTTIYPLAELPFETASGRYDGTGNGVIWPTFQLTGNEEKVVVLSSYSPPEGNVIFSPLQVTRVDIASSAIDDNAWHDLTDSLISSTSGGRAMIARSAGGKLGAVWFAFSREAEEPSGIFFAESNDDGVTWGQPVLILDSLVADRGQANSNNDPDTLHAGASFDLVYADEVPHIAFTATFNNLLSGQGVFHWRGNSNQIRQVGYFNAVAGIGTNGIPPIKRQPSLSGIDLPCIAVGDDNQTMLITFNAVGGTIDSVTNVDERTYVNDTSELGFNYYKAVIVGSRDGGDSWGEMRVVQPSFGDGTDTASIEYPTMPERFAVEENGDAQLTLAFSARRRPGMFAFILADIDGTLAGDQPADRGDIQETGLYLQRMNLDASYFPIPASAPRSSTVAGTVSIARTWPNPTATGASVEYMLVNSDRAVVTLVDAMGREMRRIVDERPLAGTHTSSFDVRDLPAGEYRVVVSQNGRTTSAPLSIVR